MSKTTSLISSATERNWNKLGSNYDNKLKSFANKRLSVKSIIPKELYDHKKNIPLVNEICETAKSSQISIEDTIFNIAKILCEQAKIIDKKNVIKTFNEFSGVENSAFDNINLSTNERDLLGIVYQQLLVEGNKNTMGSYYTPFPIIENMTKGLTFDNDEKYLDPCCGSGRYLLSLKCSNPNQLFGCDTDPIAVFITKINLFIKYKNKNFTPHIFCESFLDKKNHISKEKYNYICTNPPWGAKTELAISYPELESSEIFSYFIVHSYNHLIDKGTAMFLLPEAILNVKTHKDIREFIIGKTNFYQIYLYENLFTGVMTKFIDIRFKKESNKSSYLQVIDFKTDETRDISIESFSLTQHKVISLVSEIDKNIIEKVKSKACQNLSESIFALGIVTGNNKEKLLSHKTKNSVEIFTGKDILPYNLLPAKNYIVYDRSQFQQVAADEIYFAEKKLIYKYISKKLVFAYDDQKRLFLNSANILIPNVKSMSTKTVLAFLNSNLYQYLYIRLFDEIKILKGNLMQLPFPILTKNEDKEISAIVDTILKQGGGDENIEKYIYTYYGLSRKEIEHIERVIEK